MKSLYRIIYSQEENWNVPGNFGYETLTILLVKIYFYVTVQISWYTSIIQIILEKQCEKNKRCGTYILYIKENLL